MHLRQVDVCTAACPQKLSLVGAAEVMIILVRVSAIVTSGFNLTVRACFETFRLNLDTSPMFFVLNIRNTTASEEVFASTCSVPDYRLFTTGISLTTSWLPEDADRCPRMIQ